MYMQSENILGIKSFHKNWMKRKREF